MPHLSAGRMVQEGQLIHESAIEFLKKEKEAEDERLHYRSNVSMRSAAPWIMQYILLNILGVFTGMSCDLHYSFEDVLLAIWQILSGACIIVKPK